MSPDSQYRFFRCNRLAATVYNRTQKYRKLLRILCFEGKIAYFVDYFESMSALKSQSKQRIILSTLPDLLQGYLYQEIRVVLQF